MPSTNEPMPEGTDAVIEGAGADFADEEGLAQEVGAVPSDEKILRDTEGQSGPMPSPGGPGGGAVFDDEVKADLGSNGSGGQRDVEEKGGTGYADDGAGSGTGASWATGGSSAFFDKFTEMRAQSYDHARAYAVQGKDRATGALDELLGSINDAADQVDDRIGGGYGDYVRRAASGLGDFNEALKGKDVDELFAEARALVARAPAVAVGTAAALGFVVARLARAGMPDPTTPGAGKAGAADKKD